MFNRNTSIFSANRSVHNAVTRSEVETFDIMAINGQNTDIPKFKDHDHVLALCKHFVPVHRKRVSDRTVEYVQDENGEDIWIVGELGELTRSQMIEAALEYARLPGRFKR